MKTIINEYGKVILLIVIAIMLFVVIDNIEINGGKGVLNIIGRVFENNEISDNSVDVKVLQQGKQNRPNITRKMDASDLYTNVPVSLPEQFSAYDANRQAIDVQILDVLKGKDSIYVEIGEDGVRHYIQDSKSFVFREPGFYTVEIGAEDSMGITTTVFIKIAVNKKGSD